MTLRVPLCVVLLGTAAPYVAAQQVVEVKVPDTTRSQVQGFEHSLRGSIDRGVLGFQNKIKSLVPDGTKVELAYLAGPIVTGILDPEGSAVFHVLIPGIEPTDRMILSILMLQQAAQAQASTGTRVSNQAGAQGVVQPILASPPDLDKEYGAQVRLSLIDTILDNALALPIPESQSLTVFADELVPQSGAYTQRSRTLMLKIKGADLIALRAKQISREEAQGRIVEYKYPN